jgi:hypothetical protein
MRPEKPSAVPRPLGGAGGTAPEARVTGPKQEQPTYRVAPPPGDWHRGEHVDVGRSSERGGDAVGEGASSPQGLTEQMTEFLKSTFESFGNFLAERFADAHGLTLIYKTVKWIYGAHEWARVAEDGGGVDIAAPFTLEHDVVLNVEFHIGRDPNTPPITVGLAPTGESGAGAVAIGRLEADPAPWHSEAGGGQALLSEGRLGPVQVVPLLPPETQEGLEPAAAAFVARKEAGEWLHSRLLTEGQRLRGAGVRCVVGYDAKAGVAVWVNLDDTSQLKSAVSMTAEGQLRTELVPGEVDLIIGQRQGGGLAASLHRKDSRGLRGKSSVTPSASTVSYSGNQGEVPVMVEPSLDPAPRPGDTPFARPERDNPQLRPPRRLRGSSPLPFQYMAVEDTKESIQTETTPQGKSGSGPVSGTGAPGQTGGDATRPAAQPSARKRHAEDPAVDVKPCWQYAQLTVTVDGRAPASNTFTFIWHGPGQIVGEDYSDSDQTLIELLNRFGAEGWELADLQHYREGDDGSGTWEASRLRTIYTFKRPVPPAAQPGSHQQV